MQATCTSKLLVQYIHHFVTHQLLQLTNQPITHCWLISWTTKDEALRDILFKQLCCLNIDFIDVVLNGALANIVL